MTQRITLATLAMATAQQVFEQVARHLMTQRRQASYPASRDNSICQYRIPDVQPGSTAVLLCAAGCLIDEAEYTAVLENKSWSELHRQGKVPSDHCELITKLQRVHDAKFISVNVWLSELWEVGTDAMLDTEFLEEYQ